MQARPTTLSVERSVRIHSMTNNNLKRDGGTKNEDEPRRFLAYVAGPFGKQLLNAYY